MVTEDLIITMILIFVGIIGFMIYLAIKGRMGGKEDEKEYKRNTKI